MDYFIYQNDKFKCLLPDFCKVKSDAPELTAESKNQKKKKAFLAILVNPDISIIEAYQSTINNIRIVDDENRNQNEIRRGAFQGKWKGVELLWEIFWFHNKSYEYGWWLHLKVNGNDVCIQLAFDGDLSRDEAAWVKVFDSIEI